MHIPDMLTEKRNDRSMMDALFPATSIGPDYADLERRVADLEDRAHRQDAADASKRRLKEMGLVFPSGESLK